MNKATIKYYLIPLAVIVVIVLLLFLLPVNKKNAPETKPSPTVPAVKINLPTKVLLPDKTNPTLVPPPAFTGADANQELPADLKAIGEQKTTLRRLLPVTLPFATIEFDYENDTFIVHLSDPKEQNKTLFDNWKNQNYPALTESGFVFY